MLFIGKDKNAKDDLHHHLFCHKLDPENDFTSLHGVSQLCRRSDQGKPSLWPPPHELGIEVASDITESLQEKHLEVDHEDNGL